MKISTNKGFKKVAIGEIYLMCVKVEMKPKAKPQKVILHYEDEHGATIKETFDFKNEVGARILGSRIDLAMGGVPEGTEVDTSEIPELFLGKIAHMMTKEVEGKDKDGNGTGKFYVNIAYVMSYKDPEETEEDDDDEDDL